jgi:hypothetical protein
VSFFTDRVKSRWGRDVVVHVLEFPSPEKCEDYLSSLSFVKVKDGCATCTAAVLVEYARTMKKTVWVEIGGRLSIENNYAVLDQALVHQALRCESTAISPRAQKSLEAAYDKLRSEGKMPALPFAEQFSRLMVRVGFVCTWPLRLGYAVLKRFRNWRDSSPQRMRATETTETRSRSLAESRCAVCNVALHRLSLNSSIPKSLEQLAATFSNKAYTCRHCQIEICGTCSSVATERKGAKRAICPRCENEIDVSGAVRL